MYNPDAGGGGESLPPQFSCGCPLARRGTSPVQVMFRKHVDDIMHQDRTTYMT